MSRERSGFSGLRLSCVLVALGVAGVAAGVLLNAIVKVREAAQRSSSQCRLGCSAKALQNFASASPDGSSLPTGNWSDPRYPATGPFAAILPFIENLPTTPPATNVISFTGPAERNNTSRPPGLSDYTYNPG